MSNQKITNFFPKPGNENSKSDTESDSSDCVEEINLMNNDITEYENILNLKQSLKEKTKIVLIKKSAVGSPVWNFFGAMYISHKHVLTKYYLCKTCYEETPMRLKG